MSQLPPPSSPPAPRLPRARTAPVLATSSSAWAWPWGPLALLLLAAFATAALQWRRAPQITDDWQGWRQADTHAMARSQAFEGFAPLSPRIDWRGDGPGHVEAEAPIYPLLVGVALRAGGDSPWPGQLLSLCCVLLAAALLYRALALRYGGLAGWLALLAVLTGQGALVISTSIQPDTLSFLAFTIGWLAFLAYLDGRSTGALVTWIAATALAGLVKPTTLELGLAQFLLCLFAHRRALRDPRLWLGWILVLAVVAVYLLHARQLYLTHGNTFGVLSGGDSKLPALERLAEPRSWFELGRHAVVWGLGWPSLLAIAILVARRRAGARFGGEILALAIAALALNVLAFRYTAGPFGTHYHLPHAVLGAYLVARAVAALIASAPTVHAASSIVTSSDPEVSVASVTDLRAPRLPRAVVRAFALAFVALAAFSAYRAERFLRRQQPQPETELGLALAGLAAPDTLVAVRARAERYNAEWRTPNNFEDPRVFYLSRTKGWVLPNDLLGAEATARLDDLIRRGARFYAHVAQIPPDAELRAFLAARGQRVFTSPAGEIYELRARP